MPRRSTKKERGVFEKDPGSEIWWIRYYIDGRERREKVGRKKDASDLYKIRKADALRGVKLPTNMKNKGVKFEVLGTHAIDWYIEHGRKDIKNFRIRMNIILKDFGYRIADEIKPSEIDAWLKGHDRSPATKNRYKNVFGKTFKIAFADGKVSSNPARLVEQRPEKNARLRFLSADEELRLRDAISKRCPQHMPELDIGLNTGMRKGEQYSLEWSQVPWENPTGPQETALSKGAAADDLLPLLRGVPDSRVANLKQWIVTLEFQENRTVIYEFFDVLRSLTKGLTLELSEISRDPIEIRVKTDGGIVPLSAVSQGTGSVMSWIGTLLERMHEAGLSKSDRALVLIDEIDAHMHPKWQQSFVQAFSEAFPSVQIIATTHSPLFIGSLKKDQIWLVRKGPMKSRIGGLARIKDTKDGIEVTVTGPEPDPDEAQGRERETYSVRIPPGAKLRIKEGEVVEAGEAITLDDVEIGAERIDIPPEGWRVDQILTLPYFGLETTRDTKTAQMIDDYTRLVASAAPAEEVERLAAKLAVRAPAPPGERRSPRSFPADQ